MTHDPLWMRAFLGVHIVAGASSFLLAPIALATVKGGKAHKRWGMIYLWSMGVVAATALPMALYRPVLFLALVAVFSFYFAFSGFRATRLKALARGGSAEPVDWIAAIVTFASSAALALLGAFKPVLVQNMGVVSIVFGIAGMRVASIEMWKFSRKPTNLMSWWYSHVINMLGSYIAAWTAFSAVTLSQYLGPTWLVWLWPTALGVPAIILTVGYYKRRFGSPRSVPA